MLSQKSDIVYFISAFLAAVVAATALTRLVRQGAMRLGLVDQCAERKVHEHPVPRVGGVAIVLAALAAAGVVAFAFGWSAFGSEGRRLLVVFAGALVIHIVGLVDDLRPMRARWKFLTQLAVALAVFAAGLRVTTLSLPFVGIVDLGFGVGLLFTVIWLVGISNAFNLIDGLDGLASGAALFALTAMFIVASMNGLVGPALVTIILAGATLGFLFFNFPPATIFLGDSGSLFLGFMLAGVSLLSSQKSPAVVAVAIPIVSLGLPVLDTTLAVLRRFLRGQPIFSADRAHIHHRLLGRGHSPRRVALFLYGVCALLGLGGMLLVNDSGYVALVLVIVGLGVGVAVQRLRYYEFQELARVVRHGVRQRGIIGRNVRIREASVRVSTQTDLATVFSTLATTFAESGFTCAEVRLRRTFAGASSRNGNGHGLAIAKGHSNGNGSASANGHGNSNGNGNGEYRRDDDFAVWTWCPTRVALTSLWEIKLPFLGPSGERIGSLVLWQDGASADVGLSHVHTIARELRLEVERKLLTLWPGPVADVSIALSAGLERALPLDIAYEPGANGNGERDDHVNLKERAPDSGRGPDKKRTQSGSFHLRSAPSS